MGEMPGARQSWGSDPKDEDWYRSEKFVLIDGHNMIFRAIYANAHGEPLTSPSGEPTKGTYYFCRMLFSLVEYLNPSYLVMAMDLNRKSTWRRQLYPEYKANRDRKDKQRDGAIDEEAVFTQVARIKEITELLGVPTMVAKGFEADDIIATLAKKGCSKDVGGVVVSRDEDLHQIVSPMVRLLDASSNEWVSPADVERKWGVPVSKVVEVKALTGDDGDNIPGVRGIGPKKAAAAILKHGTASRVKEAVLAGEMFPKLRELFEKHDVELARTLSQVRYDVPVELSAKKLAFNTLRVDRARPVFQELGFQQWS